MTQKFVSPKLSFLKAVIKRPLIPCTENRSLNSLRFSAYSEDFSHKKNRVFTGKPGGKINLVGKACNDCGKVADGGRDGLRACALELFARAKTEQDTDRTHLCRVCALNVMPAVADHQHAVAVGMTELRERVLNDLQFGRDRAVHGRT